MKRIAPEYEIVFDGPWCIVRRSVEVGGWRIESEIEAEPYTFRILANLKQD